VAAAAFGLSGFRTPSNNIHCAYVPKGTASSRAFLRCDIFRRAGERKRPRGCEGDYGAGFSVRRTGRASILCISDTVYDARYRVLRYGRTWRRGGITCRSRESGLRCTNRSGHGFFLSRARQYTF
jgi:hypothetical protein